MAKNKYNKPCQFCLNNVNYVDYKNLPLIQKYVSRFGRIVPRYYTGNCLKHQKDIAKAVKNARVVALLAFVR